MKKATVPQDETPLYANLPEISDPSKFAGAFGLSKEYIKKLETARIKGSGKVINP